MLTSKWNTLYHCITIERATFGLQKVFGHLMNVAESANFIWNFSSYSVGGRHLYWIYIKNDKSVGPEQPTRRKPILDYGDLHGVE
jgi:hypothetical protein